MTASGPCCGLGCLKLNASSEACTQCRLALVATTCMYADRSPVACGEVSGCCGRSRGALGAAPAVEGLLGLGGCNSGHMTSLQRIGSALLFMPTPPDMSL